MKDLEISKKLIKAVLEKEIENLSEDFSFYIDGDFIEDYIIFSDDGEQIFDYNIYKFALKCKEWAMNKGYQIISGLSDEPAYREQDEKAYAKVLWYEGDDVHREYKGMYFMANTEVEAVIKASDYILNNLDFEASQKEAFECLNDLDKFNKLQDA